ncbi:hypothetical protein RRG08_002189 [Elysia crispata]|uniref:Uncharacterized protein n=1 Tax=Elysia crispata TaxID=231223 RepID=A0AAE1DDI0_9GAST|nr:hypothetical protein RRG08_002189 [Elysia crispata]
MKVDDSEEKMSSCWSANLSEQRPLTGRKMWEIKRRDNCRINSGTIGHGRRKIRQGCPSEKGTTTAPSHY